MAFYRLIGETEKRGMDNGNKGKQEKLDLIRCDPGAVYGHTVYAAVWNIFDDKWEAAGILWTLFIGAMSRIMMGFSATLFGSSFKTFMYQLVLIGCVDLYILIRILGRIGNKAVKTGILAALTVIACISYYNNYQWLISYYQWLMTRR